MCGSICDSYKHLVRLELLDSTTEAAELLVNSNTIFPSLKHISITGPCVITKVYLGTYISINPSLCRIFKLKKKKRNKTYNIHIELSNEYNPKNNLLGI